MKKKSTAIPTTPRLAARARNATPAEEAGIRTARELTAAIKVGGRMVQAVTMAVGTKPTQPTEKIFRDLVRAEMKKGGPRRGK